MSSLVENATIKIRRDTAANWTSNNPTLASGEWGLETDTRHIKIGDGSTAWNSLTYHIGGSDIKNITTVSAETETLPDPADIGGTYTIGRFGAGTGTATWNAPAGVNIRWPDGAITTDIVFAGNGNAVVIERAGELYVQEYEDNLIDTSNWKSVTKLANGQYGSGIFYPYSTNIPEASMWGTLNERLFIVGSTCLVSGVYESSTARFNASKAELTSLTEVQILMFNENVNALTTITINSGATGNWDNTNEVALCFLLTGARWR